MKTVTSITAREILDSRGNPTVEADIVLEGTAHGRASVPSGASTGSHEAVELRDGDARYGGKGVQHAVRHIREDIGPKILGTSFDQRSLDEALISLDGSLNKANLGANALLAVSLAFSRASAEHDNVQLHDYFRAVSKTSEKPVLPVPLINILNGGKHALHSTDIQEFMIVPVGAPSFAEALRYGTEVFHALKKILTERGLSTAVGDEGGFAVPLSSNREALELLMMAIEKAKLIPGKDVSLAIDAASSELFIDGSYDLASEKRKLTSDEMIALYADWAKAFPLISIEDGLAEDDWAGYAAMTGILGKSVQIVGDDLFVTNVARLKEGIEKKAANAILIKLNQIGTVSETIDAVTLARENGYASIISHRSGETEDATIADFAVGLATGQIKTGSTSRGERTAKYNQLLRIEESLGADAEYFGRKMIRQ